MVQRADKKRVLYFKDNDYKFDVDEGSLVVYSSLSERSK